MISGQRRRSTRTNAGGGGGSCCGSALHCLARAARIVRARLRETKAAAFRTRALFLCFATRKRRGALLWRRVATGASKKGERELCVCASKAYAMGVINARIRKRDSFLHLTWAAQRKIEHFVNDRRSEAGAYRPRSRMNARPRSAPSLQASPASALLHTPSPLTSCWNCN